MRKGTFSGGTNFVDTMSALLGIPQNNFAFGGALTATGAIPNSGFTQQIQGVVTSGKTIAPSDLVEISIGGNYARAYYQNPLNTLAGVPAAATTKRGSDAGRSQGPYRCRCTHDRVHNRRCQPVTGGGLGHQRNQSIHWFGLQPGL